MTRILPSIPLLPPAPIERRHAPAGEAEHERGYERFRPCLRWEFSFTCAFCQLHEAQICPGGAAGSAQFWIEHLETQSERPDLRNVYSNLVYACRRCNLARRFLERRDVHGFRLLDPCLEAWGEHFLIEEDQLRAQTPDGIYTAQTYDVNAPTKVALRRDRREAVDEALHVLATVPALLEHLMAGIDFRPGPEQRTRLEIAEQLHKALAAARRMLLQLSAIPQDAEESCACDLGTCDLPEWAIGGLLHVELEPGRH